MRTDNSLAAALVGLIIPAPDPAIRGRALCKAVSALRFARSVDTGAAQPWTTFSARPRVFIYAAAAGLVLLAAGAALTTRRQQAVTLSSLVAERTVLAQMEALFGSRLDAVIELAGGAPDIRLSVDAGAADQPSLAQPVFVQFQRGGQRTIRVLSYSGRAVCVTLGNHRTCFEPLVTGSGGVILDGERFYWTSNQPSSEFNGYRVTACLLPRS